MSHNQISCPCNLYSGVNFDKLNGTVMQYAMGVEDFISA